MSNKRKFETNTTSPPSKQKKTYVICNDSLLSYIYIIECWETSGNEKEVFFPYPKKSYRSFTRLKE